MVERYRKWRLRRAKDRLEDVLHDREIYRRATGVMAHNDPYSGMSPSVARTFKQRIVRCEDEIDRFG